MGLFDAKGPWLVRAEPDDALIAHEARGVGLSKGRIEYFDGHQMTTKDQFMLRMAERFGLSESFPGGLDSFADIMQDIDMSEYRVIILIIEASDKLLEYESDMTKSACLSTLEDVGEYWSACHKYHPAYKDPRGFHVVLA